MSDKLQKLYEDYGFPSYARLYNIAKSNNIKVTQKEAKEFVDSQQVAQLHKKAPTIASTPITVDGATTEYQIDLLDQSAFSRTNKGYKWILILENIWDRKAMATAIKTKSPSDVLPALKDMIDAMGKPVQIVSDSGNEFGGVVDRWLTSQDINHRKVDVGDHRSLGIIDSFARYVKNSLSKHMTHHQTTNWIDYLDTLINSYNKTPHSSLKLKGYPALTPNQASHMESDVRLINNEKVEDASENKKQPTLSIGDTVRVLKRKAVFDRGYSIRYSITVYKIVKVEGHYYELDNGKRYRAGSLQKVKAAKIPNPLASARADEKSEVAEVKDVRKQASQSHKVDNILKFKEGVSQDNRRSGLRSRSPVMDAEDKRYGKIKW